MSRRVVKPTVFHDDSRSSDAGSVVAAPSRSKPRSNRDPAKDVFAAQNDKLVAQQNGYAPASVKVTPLGPDGEIQVDFNTLPIESLQKYIHHYNLTVDQPLPPKKKKHQSNGKKRPHEDTEDDLSNSEDESPYRIDLGAWRPRINKPELAKAARTHFSSLQQARENESIVHFLYAVKTQDKVLKLRVEN